MFILHMVVTCLNKSLKLTSSIFLFHCLCFIMTGRQKICDSFTLRNTTDCLGKKFAPYWWTFSFETTSIILNMFWHFSGPWENILALWQYFKITLFKITYKTNPTWPYLTNLTPPFLTLLGGHQRAPFSALKRVILMF